MGRACGKVNKHKLFMKVMGLVEWGFLWGAFIGLFAIINPFSTGLIFVGLSAKLSSKERIRVAKKASVISALILLFFLISGSLIFKFFDITLESFRIAGGLLVSFIGFKMINPLPYNRQGKSEEKDTKRREDIAVVPLALPMLSGPGAIATLLVLLSESSGLINWFGLAVVIVLISFISYFVLINVNILKKLGETGINVIERLMGLIVIVIGIQFIIDTLSVLR